MSLLILSLACAADTPSEATDSAGSGEGTIALSFAIDPDYRDAMDEAAAGPFFGSIFYSDDVSSFGPEDGVESLGGVDVDWVDLTGDGPTAVLLVAGPMPAEKLVILGFIDSDGNAAAGAEDPDSGDPVTVPGDNRFTVESDVETPVEVYFGLLNP